MVRIGNNWDTLLKNDFESESYLQLREFLKEEYREKSILPDMNLIFNALKLTPPEQVSVVILGQDPYPTKGNAMGLSFSVNSYMPLPKSLQNIYSEIQSDLNINPPSNGDLTPWAKQGVLLLNSTLTVIEGHSASHSDKGWEILTDSIIKKISEYKKHIVFILWGRLARGKKRLISPNGGHLILESAHPSPLSAYNGFFGSRPFSKTNAFLIAHGKSPINWGNCNN